MEPTMTIPAQADFAADLELEAVVEDALPVKDLSDLLSRLDLPLDVVAPALARLRRSME